jgi:hypothetical protein
MRDEFLAKIEAILPPERPLENWQARLIEAIMDEYEFSCKSFVYAGPGHQSKHECTNQRPHPIEGEHYDSLYEWVGTSVTEDLGPRVIGGREYGRVTKLVSNAPHEGEGCMCRIPSELRA